jgi:WD40 repeat protein
MVLFANVGEGYSVDIWDADDDYRHVTALRGHEDRISCLQFAPDGERVLASTSMDCFIIIWDISENKMVHKLPHEVRVCSIAFTRGADRLVARSVAHKILIYDLTSCHSVSLLSSFAFVAIQGSTVCLSNDDSRIITSCAENEDSDFEDYFAAWSLESRDGVHDVLCTTQEIGCSQQIRCIAINPVDDSIATGSGNFLVLIWEYLEDQHCLKKRGELVGHTREVTCCAYFPNGCQLVSGSLDCTYKIWDVVSLSLLLSVDTPQPMFSIACSREWVACGSKKSVVVHNVQTCEEVRRFAGDGASSRIAYSALVVVLL